MILQQQCFPNSLEFVFIFDIEVLEDFYTKLTVLEPKADGTNDESSSFIDEPKPDTQPSFHPQTPASNDPILQQESIFNSLSRTDIFFLTSVFVYYTILYYSLVLVYVYPDLFFLNDIAPLDEQARLIKFGGEVLKPVQR